MTRDSQIARIAAVLDRVPVGDYPWRPQEPHHPEYAAALYEAGLRAPDASDRHELAATIMAALNRHGASYRIPVDPSDLAYAIADDLLAPEPAREAGLRRGAGTDV